MKTLLAILGPTAVGKTTTTISLAKNYKTDIISCDSRQFFSEMSIGTAKPDTSELAEAPHHFIGHKSITELYTAGQFEHDAIEKIKTLHLKNDIVTMTGGSGMYARAVFNGLDDIPADLTIRAQLNAQVETEGLEPLKSQLKVLDPVFYQTIDNQNPQRVVRALEVCLTAGKPYSTFRSNTVKKRDFKTLKIGLNLPRDILYDRINRRVDLMIATGLVQEVESLLPFKKLNALNTVGYKEIIAHIEGRMSLDEAVEQIKQNTRRFAKRQITWFKKEDGLVWFNPQDVDGIIKHVTLQHG